MCLCALALIWTLNDLRDNLDFSLALLFVGALYRCYTCVYISFSSLSRSKTFSLLFFSFICTSDGCFTRTGFIQILRLCNLLIITFLQTNMA